MGLSTKQQLFIDSYLKCFNATQAAREAGYSGGDNVMAQRGYELVRNSEIQKIISMHFAASAMSADEVLQRLADLARNAETENNRIKALELLSKRWGILQDKMEVSGQIENTLVILPSKDD